MIYNYLALNKDKFVNAEDIVLYLKSQGKNIGTATVYRYINYLEENNQVIVEIKNYI